MFLQTEEISPSFKEPRQKALAVRNWPAEGLHERPVYNEQTAEIEKFDFVITQSHKIAAKVKPEKKRKLKVPKKKYIPKRINVRKNNKNTKKTEDELVPIKDILGLIKETSQLYVESFLKNVASCRRNGFYKCSSGNKENDGIQGGKSEEKAVVHSDCSEKYDAVLKNQCQIYSLCNEEIDFKITYKKWKNGQFDI